MKIYVGYVIFDYIIPVAISTDKEKVKKYLETKFLSYDSPYIEEYDLNSEIIKL